MELMLVRVLEDPTDGFCSVGGRARICQTENQQTTPRLFLVVGEDTERFRLGQVLLAYTGFRGFPMFETVVEPAVDVVGECEVGCDEGWRQANAQRQSDAAYLEYASVRLPWHL